MTTLTSPHDLLAAVPFLIGYHPTDSLVLISLLDESIGMAMRIDFPQEIDPDQIDNLASHLVREKSDSALLIAYVPTELIDTDFVLDPLREAIEMRGIVLREILEVRSDRWRSLLCQDKECCPNHGNPMPDISHSRIAAEQVAGGRRLPFVDLESLTQSLTSLEYDPRLVKLISEVPEIDYESVEVKKLQRAGALALSDLLHEFEENGISTNIELICLVLARVKDLQVRDYAMGITNNENIEQLWSMWRWLLRIAPVGYVAPVATLFSAISYEKGDGALAQRALDRAFDDDATYPLAKLLRRVFAAGWPPSSFAAMRSELHPKICSSLFDQ